jgi:hypothetical protein
MKRIFMQGFMRGFMQGFYEKPVGGLCAGPVLKTAHETAHMSVPHKRFPCANWCVSCKTQNVFICKSLKFSRLSSLSAILAI